jgi:hypothetical protein
MCVMWNTVPGFVMCSLYLSEQLVLKVNMKYVKGYREVIPCVWVTVIEAVLYLVVRSDMICGACVMAVC